jgi:uncharacterized protein
MNLQKFYKLIAYVKEHQTKKDPAHDITHINRVLHNALNIAKHYPECDIDILVPAVLLHDIVLYDKKSEENVFASLHSAELARELLQKLTELPYKEIDAVCLCINECSYTKNTEPSSLESQILQDADRIESMGAIAIMRTFTSAGQLNEQLYDINDPLCEHSMYGRSAMDFIVCRVGNIVDKLHTNAAREIFKKRNIIVDSFVSAFKTEMLETGIENLFE